MKNNVDENRIRPCSGCFACSVICPKNAITIKQDKNGFYKPLISEELCIDCGLCKKVCYSYLSFTKNESKLKGYYGWHKNSEILGKSASGGLTTAITTAFISKGFSVVGCTYDIESKKAKHIIIDNEKDIDKFLGSKYFQSNLEDCVSILKDLNKDKNFLFFGTPCQILGLKKATELLKFNSENLYFVELFCHGVVSQKVWEKYLTENKKITNATKFRFRTKHYGWHISCNEFELKEKTIATERVGDLFFQAFYSKNFFNTSCYDCLARKNLSNADLRIGDFWGKRFIDNTKGVSCAISSNEKGEYIMQEISENFEVFDADIDEILKSQSYNQVYPFNDEKWEKTYSILERKSLKKAISFSNKDKPLKERVKNWLYIKLSNLKHRIK